MGAGRLDEGGWPLGKLALGVARVRAPASLGGGSSIRFISR